MQAHTVAVSVAGEDGTTTEAAAAGILSGSAPAATGPLPQLSEDQLRDSCQKYFRPITIAVKRQSCMHGFALPK